MAIEYKPMAEALTEAYVYTIIKWKNIHFCSLAYGGSMVQC